MIYLKTGLSLYRNRPVEWKFSTAADGSGAIGTPLSVALEIVSILKLERMYGKSIQLQKNHALKINLHILLEKITNCFS